MTIKPDPDQAVTLGDLDRLGMDAPSSQAAQGDALVFSVAGTPVAQPRARWAGGRMVSTAQGDAKRWKAAIIRAAQLAGRNAPKPWMGQRIALRIDLAFSFQPRQVSWLGKSHTHKPDKDNLEKLVLDAVKKAGLIFDDAYVAIGTTEKRWLSPSGVRVTIQPAGIEPISAPTQSPDWLCSVRSSDG